MNLIMPLQVNRKLDLPLGRVMAVLAACLTTLVGISVGHDPEIVAWRVGSIVPIAALCGFVIGRMLHSVADRRTTGPSK